VREEDWCGIRLRAVPGGQEGDTTVLDIDRRDISVPIVVVGVDRTV